MPLPSVRKGIRGCLRHVESSVRVRSLQIRESNTLQNARRKLNQLLTRQKSTKSEERFSFIDNRINKGDDAVKDIQNAFEDYRHCCHKQRLSEKGLAEALENYSAGEMLPQTTKVAAMGVASVLRAHQRHHDVRLSRLSESTCSPVEACRQSAIDTKLRLMQANSSHRKEKMADMRREKLKGEYPINIELLEKTENKFARIQQSSNFKEKLLEEQFDKFEFEKIVMLDNILDDFIKIELIYHAKYVDDLAIASKYLQNVDICKDIKTIREEFRLHQCINHDNRSASGQLTLKQSANNADTSSETTAKGEIVQKTMTLKLVNDNGDCPSRGGCKEYIGHVRIPALASRPVLRNLTANFSDDGEPSATGLRNLTVDEKTE